MSTPTEILENAIGPAKRLLPTLPFKAECCIQLLATGLQESKLVFRHQHNDGPARGILQFEQGTAKTRGGITGVMMHNATIGLAKGVCDSLEVPWNAKDIWERMETDDVLSMAFGRLLYWTSPKPFPVRGNAQGAWDLYVGTWRPGKPHREFWDANYNSAVSAVIGAQE